MSRHRPAPLDALAARWPGRCHICHGWTRGGLCSACLAQFAAPRPRCRHCALPVAMPTVALCGACLRQPPGYSRAQAAVDYAFPWDRLLGAFKFHHQPELARPLVRLMTRSAAQMPQAPAPDWVLPVPLGTARLAERGYNQAWELARRLAPWLGAPADATLLARWRETPHQVGLDRAARAHNLRDAFVVPPEARAALRGARVALVDDVVTTGATADAAARTLREAGAAEVNLWMVARTPAPEA